MFVTNIKKQGGSSIIILPKDELEKAGVANDILVAVELKKYKSSYQDLFEKYMKSQEVIKVSYDSEIVEGIVVDLTQDKVKIKQNDEITVLFYKDIQGVDK